MMFGAKKKIKLPTTLTEYDDLVDKVVETYCLTDKHHAAAIMSVAIRHIPNEQAYTTLDYLGQYIQKNIANYVAHHKGETLKHGAQVAQLADLIKTDPNNQQAWDELQKAANEGSEQAKEALTKLEKDRTEMSVQAPAIAG